MQRVTVIIDDREYTVVANEGSSDVRESAKLVDDAIAEIKSSARLSQVDCAVLAAMNIADKYFKEKSGTDNLRAQIRSYVDENSALRGEIARLKRSKED